MEKILIIDDDIQLSELIVELTELKVYVRYGIYPITWIVKSNKL